MNPFLGEIRLFSFNFQPRGWHLCDGTIVPIQAYSALYALLGVQYGGNGSTNFALPDLRGRTPIHFSGNSPQGMATGTETVSLMLSQMPIHNHQLMGSSTQGGANQPINAIFAGSATADPHYSPDTTVTPLAPNAIQPAGGGVPHNNMQPFLVLNYCIAMSGIFPARN